MMKHIDSSFLGFPDMVLTKHIQISRERSMKLLPGCSADLTHPESL